MGNSPLTNPQTGEPLPQTKQPGYYPGFSTLAQRKFWDATTRRVIEDRIQNVPPIRFFTPEELPLVTAVCDRIVPQDDRVPEFRIPIVNYIDERLFRNRIHGYRYEDMPSDQDAYHLGLRAIDETARAITATSFAELDPLNQDHILKFLHDGNKIAAHEIWASLSIKRFWELLVGDCVAAYYSHPWAWDEIGFGGPAYPRAYTRLENGLPEPWEEDERRYEWAAPDNTISDAGELSGTTEEQSPQGQGGTH